MRDMRRFVPTRLLILCWLPWIQGGYADDFIGSGDDSEEIFPYSSFASSMTEIINIETVSASDTGPDTGLLLPMTSSVASSLPTMTSSLQDTPTATPTTTVVPIVSTSIGVSPSITVSTPSSLSSFATSSVLPSSSPTTTPSTVPMVTVVILNATAMEVSWNVISSVSGYVVVLTEVSDGRSKRQNNVIEIEIIGGHVTSHVIVGLKPYTRYNVQVATIDANGNRGQLSLSAITTTEEGIPGPPTNVTWTAVGVNINITWLPPTQPNGDITQYIVIITTDNGDRPVQYNVSGDKLSLLIERPSGDFSVSVLAVNGAGMGIEEPGTIAPTEEEGDDGQRRQEVSSGVIAAIVICMIVLVAIVTSLIIIGVFLWWRHQNMTGGMDIDVGGEMVFKSSNTDLSKVENALQEDDSQLTAKRWMRANANYSTSAVLLPSISDLVTRYTTAEDVVDTKTIKPLGTILEQSMQEPHMESSNSSSERTPDTPSTMSSVCSKTHFEVNKIVPLPDPGPTGARPLESPHDETDQPDQPPKAFEDYHVDKQSLNIIEQIGMGECSKVMKGTFSPVAGPIVIKILNEDSTYEAEFIESAKIMSRFTHENILKLIGTCLVAPPPLMILMTYMNLGDLKKYLTRVRRRTRLENVSCDFGIREQLKISIQIASGMEYLASQSHIHKALQAKYIMLGEDHHVRIGGFRMSLTLSDPKRYKEIKKANKLPIKWLSLEAINTGKFTSQSDVWSYGVVLWELFAFGLTPYRGVQNEDVIKQLAAGRRLIKPSDCPGDIFTLMLHTWNEKPQDRPSFSSLRHHLMIMSESLIRERERQNIPPTLRELFQDPTSPTNDDSEPFPPPSSASPHPPPPQTSTVKARHHPTLEQQLSNESTKLVRGSATLSAIELALSHFDSILSDDSASQVEEVESHQRGPTPDLCSVKPQKQTVDDSDDDSSPGDENQPSSRESQTYTRL